MELERRLLEGETTEVLLRQQVVSLKPGQEQMRMQWEDLHRVETENRSFVERLDKAIVEISTLRLSVELARDDAVVASSKNVRLINQLKGNQVKCGALVRQLGEMHEQLEELAEQKSQFCKQVAELQSHMSTVCSKYVSMCGQAGGYGALPKPGGEAGM